MIDLARAPEQIEMQLGRVNARFPGAIPLDKLLENVLDGAVQIFPIGEISVYCCQLRENEAEILAAAGDLKELLEAEPHICAWYRQHGAALIRLQGRTGWRKLLETLGWHATGRGQELIKTLREGEND